MSSLVSLAKFEDGRDVHIDPACVKLVEGKLEPSGSNSIGIYTVPGKEFTVEGALSEDLAALGNASTQPAS